MGIPNHSPLSAAFRSRFILIYRTADMVVFGAVNSTSAKNEPPQFYLYNDAKIILKSISVKKTILLGYLTRDCIFVASCFDSITDVEACVAMTTHILKIAFFSQNQL